MASGKKIADTTARMTNTPIIEWIRSVLLRTKRMDKDIKKVVRPDFVNPQRYPGDQSARTQPPSNIPGGIHHRLAQNYYLDHDARRAVDPPPVVSRDGKLMVGVTEQQLQSIGIGPQVSLGPTQNFGLPASIRTPGIGYEWARNQTDELPSQQKDEEFVPLERYDSYRRPTTAAS